MDCVLDNVQYFGQIYIALHGNSKRHSSGTLPNKGIRELEPGIYGAQAQYCS